MITKESQANIEVFAIDDGQTSNCRDCVFVTAPSECLLADCHRVFRSDGRSVYFVPITDVKTTIAYAAQQQQKKTK